MKKTGNGSFRMSRSERKRAWAAYERAKARLHKHVCEWCPADDIYTCTKAPCQHLKKKPCPSHKWNAKKGIAPERLEFTPPPIEVHVGQYADFYTQAAKETVKKMAESLNNLIMIDMAAVEKKVVGTVIEDEEGYAKYEDFI